MGLIVKKVNKKLADYKLIEKTYNASFHANERISFELLSFLSHRRHVRFVAFYDEHQFCGIAYFILHKQTTFLLYIVIAPDKQQAGYGSQILSWLKNQYPSNSIGLFIDEVDPTYVDFDLRVKRYGFYQKNEFTKTDYIMQYKRYRYQVLTYGNGFNINDFKWAYIRFSYGTHWPKIVKEPKSSSSTLDH